MKSWMGPHPGHSNGPSVSSHRRIGSPRRARRWGCLLALLLGALVPVRADSQELRSIDLGEGLGLTQRWERCGCVDLPSGEYDCARCPSWHPIGFDFGDRPILQFANAFARIASSGRIVAVYRSGRAGVLYTDDRGVSWHSGRWEWPHAAHALAFDAGSRFGVAAGEMGYIWNTHDGGETWTYRGSSAGVLYTEVAVIGRLCVLVDSGGNIWRSRNGGGALDHLARSRGISLRTLSDEIVITTTERTLRVHRDGRVGREP